MTANIIWNAPSVGGSILQLAFCTVREAFGRRDIEPAVISLDELDCSDEVIGGPARIVLPSAVAFSHCLDARTLNTGDQKKIVANKFADLAPILDDDLRALASNGSGASDNVELLFVRESTLSEIERLSAARGVTQLSLSPECQQDSVFLSPNTLQGSQIGRVSWAACLLWMLLALWGATAVAARSMETTANALRANVAEVRLLAVERAERDRELTAVDALAAWGANEKTIAARMNSLNELSAATPDGAWWMSVELNDRAQTISGLSSNAATVLQSISQAFPQKSVSFSEPVMDEGQGQQSFVIQLGAAE
ncbi:MAG: PilN domain-containing protein [Pseudomonadota bacterium]